MGLLGDPTRRAIFELLAHCPSSVGELAQQLPVSRPAVSQHLRVLKDGGLVVSRAEGTRRVYQLNPAGVDALRAYLDRIWGEALTAFHKAADAAYSEPKQEHLMSIAPSVPAIRGKITVDVPVEHAFTVLTSSFDSWWPREFHIGRADLAEAIIEPREGGRWYERGVDGSECDWGRVLVWEPPHRLVITWQINGQWQFDPDPARASEVEVLFNADGPEQTTVELTHQYLDRLDGGQLIHDAILQESSWSGLLALFAKAVGQE